MCFVFLNLAHVHPLTWKRRGLWPMLQPPTRGRPRGFGFTFGDLSCHPSLFTVNVPHIEPWLYTNSLPDMTRGDFLCVNLCFPAGGDFFSQYISCRDVKTEEDSPERMCKAADGWNIQCFIYCTLNCHTLLTGCGQKYGKRKLQICYQCQSPPVATSKYDGEWFFRTFWFCTTWCYLVSCWSSFLL